MASSIKRAEGAPWAGGNRGPSLRGQENGTGPWGSPSPPPSRSPQGQRGQGPLACPILPQDRWLWPLFLELSGPLDGLFMGSVTRTHTPELALGNPGSTEPFDGQEMRRARLPGRDD